MAQKSKTYQLMSQELAQLVDWFESDEVNLDEAVAKYQQAMTLLQDMEAYLKTAENKIKKLSAKFDRE